MLLGLGLGHSGHDKFHVFKIYEKYMKIYTIQEHSFSTTYSTSMICQMNYYHQATSINPLTNSSAHTIPPCHLTTPDLH